MSKVVKRGRPSKKVINNNATFKVNTVKMNDLSFDNSLFQPMKTRSKVDEFFSSEGGVMPGTCIVATGDPGVGKTTVLLDILADIQKQNKKCLFISGEMNAIDMVGYVKRYPKFGDLDILFMGDYAEVNPDVVLRTALKEGYDCVPLQKTTIEGLSTDWTFDECVAACPPRTPTTSNLFRNT